MKIYEKPEIEFVLYALENITASGDDVGLGDTDSPF